MTPATNLAVIDIGTNSVKLVIAAAGGAPPRELKYAQEITRVGEGLAATGEISAAALLRTMNAIERFHHVARQYDCSRVLAFATHAFRAAANGAESAARIREQTGIDIRILSGEEEARYAYLSARSRIGSPKRHMYLFDVGGGSVDFVHGAGEEIFMIRTLPLGALHLTERFLSTDPIDPGEFNALRGHVSRTIAVLFETADPGPLRARLSPGDVSLVASGGSVTTIKKMVDPSWEHSSITTPKVRLGEIRRLEAQCLELPLVKRKRLPGLEPDRADIIPAGLAVAIGFMEATGKRVLMINPGGVRDGALVHLSQNSHRW